ncbi:MAG: hypothetical protein IPJ62_13975 [Betaproteobacteria bacterium]|nr:hypothetical protein [Betaproteobacteria bacterium]
MIRIALGGVRDRVVVGRAALAGELAARAAVLAAVPLLCLLVALGALFADAVREKAQAHHPPADLGGAGVSPATLRILLWDYLHERIRERPWDRLGFGCGIIGDEPARRCRRRCLAHAHNVFVSQWLQTGAPGFALLVALLAALATAHAASLRSADPTRALLE